MKMIAVVILLPLVVLHYYIHKVELMYFKDTVDDDIYEKILEEKHRLLII